MDAKDLMVGDWVYTKAKERNVKVRGVRVDTDNAVVLTYFGDVWWPTAEFEPIPLTEDILRKNGFEKISELHPIFEQYRFRFNPVSESYILVDFRLQSRVVEIRISSMGGALPEIDLTKYNMSVHDLQHAMRMCGIEKDIIL